MDKFILKSPWEPAGGQPNAISEILKNFDNGEKKQTLLGVTGSGKTFVMANVIEKLNIPTLIISPNKTLAAQLYSEFKNFFPDNRVEYFVSYYDFYQPEAYIPQRDIYIEKDSSINQQIDRLRLSATTALLTRKDVLVVASVSSIYSLGNPKDYKKMVLGLSKNQNINRKEILTKLVSLQYNRNDSSLERGNFRVRGDIIYIWPAEHEIVLRVEMFGDKIENIFWCHPISNKVIKKIEYAEIYPASHYVIPEEKIKKALESIGKELKKTLKDLKSKGKLLEANRLEMRTKYDMELMEETGFCSGIENYSIHFSDRKKGERPSCLLDYFPKSYLTIVDESHITIPQIRGMHKGDMSRKSNLIEYGFRLPSALDNRPNTFEEWEKKIDNVIFVSATPGPYESNKSIKNIDLIIRPTGLIDPIVEIFPAKEQVQHLTNVIKERAKLKERVLVTTLTKSLSESLTEFLQKKGIKVAYIHHELDAFDRIEVLQNLRKGKYDAVVGINLLREGIDLPEVSLVAILDADREGFLRSDTSLIQIMGRCARNKNSLVYLYADKITNSMEKAIKETNRRRNLQLEYNKRYNITPETIKKDILQSIEKIKEDEELIKSMIKEPSEDYNKREKISEIEKEMLKAAEDLDFEKAAFLRDKIFEIQGKNKKKKIKKQRKKFH